MARKLGVPFGDTNPAKDKLAEKGEQNALEAGEDSPNP